MLSLVLPSIHADSLLRMLHNIVENTTGYIEIVLFGPHHVLEAVNPGLPFVYNVKFVYESNLLGSSGAQAEAVKHVNINTDFVMALSDDIVLLEKGWDVTILENFVRRERVTGSNLFCLGPRMPWGGVNVMFGKAYPTLPLMRKSSVDRIGWYDPIFYSRYGDNDLGMRIWANGGRVEWTERPTISVHPDNARNGMTVREDDRSKFLARWQSKFPDWPDDPAKYDCGIDMDKINHFLGNTANFDSCISYHDARRKAGHLGYDGTVAADGKVF